MPENVSGQGGSFDDMLGQLRRDYAARWPEKRARLETLLAQAERGDDGEAIRDLRTEFHRLAGTGGTYGFPEVSELARAAERLVETVLEDVAGFSQSVGPKVKSYIDSLDRVFRADGREAG